ncbi:MAG: DUF2269 family protein [Gammaproteobacteria bacterium]|nr:DUF2269 family protein [Gammaproteobacteria bacterium]
MNTHALFKTVHLLGVVIFLGNLIVTAWWKGMADRAGDPRVVAFAQRQVTLTDCLFTLGGILVILAGGYGMAYAGGAGLNTGFVVLGQGLFYAAGAIWVGALIPIQWCQARMARAFADGGEIPPRYWRLSRIWMATGITAIVLPVLSLVVMVSKISI